MANLGNRSSQQHDGHERNLDFADDLQYGHGHSPTVIVALKQPRSSSPPSAMKLAIVRSAMRPRGDVPHVTQRSLNSRVITAHPVTVARQSFPVQSFVTRRTLPTARYGIRA